MKNDYFSVKDFSKKHGYKERSIRHWIFQDIQGFHKVYRKIGSKILISEKLFFKWLDKQGK